MIECEIEINALKVFSLIKHFQLSNFISTFLDYFFESLIIITWGLKIQTVTTEYIFSLISIKLFK